MTEQQSKAAKDLRDRHVRSAEAQSFENFEKHTKEFISTLQDAAGAASTLGSSAGLLSSLYSLAAQTHNILYLLHRNAEALCLVHQGDNMSRIVQPPHKSGGFRKPWIAIQPSDNLTSKDLPEQLGLIAESLSKLLGFVNDFPDTLDDVLNESIQCSIDHFNYQASRLRQHKDFLETAAIQRYMNTMCFDLSQTLAALSNSLRTFARSGVPAVAAAQARVNVRLLNISTVATIFTAVSATAVQTSLGVADQKHRLANAVNACWFSSLVLSVGAAINSAIAVSWRQTTYRSPRRSLPCWMRIWVNTSVVPLAFLVLSVAFFMLGLILFSLSSHQHIVTSVLVPVFSACSIASLASLCVWVVQERRTFTLSLGVSKKATTFESKKAQDTFDEKRGYADVTQQKERPNEDIQSKVADSKEDPDAKLWDRVDCLKKIPKTTSPPSGTSVKQLQYSSDGRFLSCMSRNGSVAIFEVQPDQIDNPVTLWGLNSTSHHAAVWSPSESDNRLFTNLSHEFSVWAYGDDTKYTGFNQKKRKPHTGDVQSIAWLSHSREESWSRSRRNVPGMFLVLKEGCIDELDGKLDHVRSHPFRDFQFIHDFAVTQDRARFLVAGTLKQSPDDPPVSPRRWEKQVIVYNTMSQDRESEIELRIPFLQEVRYIDITKDSEYALISYEDNSPPELWHLFTAPEQRTRLERVLTYLPDDTASTTVGPSSFGGLKDEVVLSVNNTGGVYIWNRTQGHLLRHITQTIIGQRIRCVAWRPSPSKDTSPVEHTSALEDTVAFGAENGQILVWTNFQSKPSESTPTSQQPSTFTSQRSSSTAPPQPTSVLSPHPEPAGLQTAHSIDSAPITAPLSSSRSLTLASSGYVNPSSDSMPARLMHTLINQHSLNLQVLQLEFRISSLRQERDQCQMMTYLDGHLHAQAREYNSARLLQCDRELEELHGKVRELHAQQAALDGPECHPDASPSLLKTDPEAATSGVEAPGQLAASPGSEIAVTPDTVVDTATTPPGA